MKEAKNQFILMDTPEFSKWLNTQDIRRSIKRIQNHHTWKPGYAHFKNNNHFKLLESMKRSHLKRRFSDIAQNITTFPDGTIAICRPLNKVPAGIRGANRGGICIEHIGNFDIGGDTMTVEHQNTIVWLNAVLCQKFKLRPDTDSIVYHHWWTSKGKRTNGVKPAKSCPGTNFFGGNSVEAAEQNFIPKIINQLENFDSQFSADSSGQMVDNNFPIPYAKSSTVPHGDILQNYLNQFSGIALKVDGWPGEKTSNAFKQVMGYYLKGDPRN